MDFGHPIFQSGILPVFVAFVLTGAIRMVGGAERGPALAGASVGLAAILAYVVILAWPAWPPGQSIQKLAYVVAAGLGLGVLADAVPVPRGVRRALVILVPLIGLAWLAEPVLRAGPDLADSAVLGTMALAALVVGWRLIRREGEADLTSAIQIGAAAIGLALIALLGATASVFQLALALGAATGGFALWNWPLMRFPAGASLLLGAGGAFIAIAGLLVLFTEASRVALALLMLVFFTDTITAGVRVGGGPLGRVLAPVITAAAAAILVLAATAVAVVLGGGGLPF
jgi:hypothetical protein